MYGRRLQKLYSRQGLNDDTARVWADFGFKSTSFLLDSTQSRGY